MKLVSVVLIWFLRSMRYLYDMFDYVVNLMLLVLLCFQMSLPLVTLKITGNGVTAFLFLPNPRLERSHFALQLLEENVPLCLGVV